MDIQEIFALEFGRLPYSTTFKTNVTGDALLYVAASVTSNNIGMCGINVKVDGNLICSPQVYINAPNVSRPLVADIGKMSAELGEHTLTLEAATAITKVNSRDYACGTMFYRNPASEPFVWRFKGPVPKYTKFKSVMSGTGVLYVAGSAFLKQTQVCGLSVVLDGKEVARTQMLPSIPYDHFALPPLFVPIQLKPKEYEIGISTTIGEVQSDDKDFYEVAIFY